MKDLPEKNKGGAHDRLHPLDKETMAEIDKMAGDQAYALAVLAQGSAATAENTADAADTMSDVKDLLVKVCQHFQIPLPKAIQASIIAGDYDPDAEDESEDDPEDDEEEDGDAESK